MKKLVAAKQGKTRWIESVKKVSQVGLFFVLGGKVWAEGTRWTDNPSIAGFRTYSVGPPDFWARFQVCGAVPRDLEYEDVHRGRVNYFEAIGKFTLIADRCIIKRNSVVNKIIAAFALPKDTRVVRDTHYKCAKCIGKVPTKTQEKQDWEF